MGIAVFTPEPTAPRWYKNDVGRLAIRSATRAEVLLSAQFRPSLIPSWGQVAPGFASGIRSGLRMAYVTTQEIQNTLRDAARKVLELQLNS